MNLRRYWEDKVQKFRKNLFLYYNVVRVSYGDFDETVSRVAIGLLEKGLKRGDRVCLLLRNIPEFRYRWFALCKIVGVAVPINANFKANECQYIVQHSRRWA